MSPTNLTRIGITTGDVDGIGFEVVAKALAIRGPQSRHQFILWRGPKVAPSLLKKIRSQFEVVSFKDLSAALSFRGTNKRQLLEIVDSRSPALWVEDAAQACKNGQLAALATAPLSKPAIAAAGLKDIGHTDILKRVCGSSSAYMGFIGEKFNVVLATGHIPISQVSQKLTAETVSDALRAALQLRSLLNPKVKTRPIALLGLNPHAGDKGLIGSEEALFLRKSLSAARDRGVAVEGPIVPDVAFQQKNWQRFSVFVACYHDQGLIPFKAFHGVDSGVHVTLGLPIRRTSVDHGTAKDIFGQNKANPNSMIEALEWAQKWAKQDV